jgi:phosphomevalonate kinase
MLSCSAVKNMANKLSKIGWQFQRCLNDNGKMAETGNPLANAEIIGISGKQYSGKDVLAQLLLDRLPDFRKIPLALAIKQEYARRHNLTLEAIEANKAQYRPELIALGDWGRKQDPDYWLKQVLAQPGKKIISDVRQKREHDLLHEHGAFLIRLNADRNVRAQRGTIVSEDDPTERELDTVSDWDAVLTNNGSVDALARQLNALI